MLFFFDTETTGLPLWDKPSEDPRQPHIVQFSAMEAHEDRDVTHNFIVKPDGWIIPPDVEKIHGISQARAEELGIDAKENLASMAALIFAADLVIGHGIDFDMRMMRIAAHRHGFCDPEKFKSVKTFCTMRASTQLCKLPPTDKMLRAGRNTFKTPKLSEAYQHFFNEKLEGAHNSLVDMQATMRIYFELQTQKAA